MWHEAARGLSEAAGIVLVLFWCGLGVLAAWILLDTFKRLIPLVLLGGVAFGGVLVIRSNLESGVAWLAGLAIVGLAAWLAIGRVRVVFRDGLGD
jgi:hypothetical protein